MEEVVIFSSKIEMLKVIGNLEIKQVQINDKKFLLVRINDDCFLTETHCPHMDYNLAEAVLSPIGLLVCPWHAYGFRLSDGHETSERCRPLKVYPILEKEGKMICRIS